MNPVEACLVLGIRESCGPAGVRAAYLREAKRHHPDAGGDEEAFKAVGQAYDLLRGKNIRLVAPPPVQHHIILNFAGGGGGRFNTGTYTNSMNDYHSWGPSWD